jgi:hypothetical protein
MDTMLDTRARVLTRADRCDRCGACAMVRVTTQEQGIWLWCGHHYDQNKSALPGILKVHDERDPLPTAKELSEGSAE